MICIKVLCLCCVAGGDAVGVIHDVGAIRCGGGYVWAMTSEDTVCVANVCKCGVLVCACVCVCVCVCAINSYTTPLLPLCAQNLTCPGTLTAPFTLTPPFSGKLASPVVTCCAITASTAPMSAPFTLCNTSRLRNTINVGMECTS